MLHALLIRFYIKHSTLNSITQGVGMGYISSITMYSVAKKYLYEEFLSHQNLLTEMKKHPYDPILDLQMILNITPQDLQAMIQNQIRRFITFMFVRK